MFPKVLRLPLFALLLLLAVCLVAPVGPGSNDSTGRVNCPGKGAGAELIWESLSHQIGSNVGM
jgi:hypothetical protein